MKHHLLPLFCMFLGATPILAQTDASLLQPKVQEFKPNKQQQTVAVPQSYQLILGEGSCPHAAEALKQLLPNKQEKPDSKSFSGKKVIKPSRNMLKKFRHTKKVII